MAAADLSEVDVAAVKQKRFSIKQRRSSSKKHRRSTNIEKKAVEAQEEAKEEEAKKEEQPAKRQKPPSAAALLSRQLTDEIYKDVPLSASVGLLPVVDLAKIHFQRDLESFQSVPPDFETWARTPRSEWHDTAYYQRVHRLTWANCIFGRDASRQILNYGLLREIMAGYISGALQRQGPPMFAGSEYYCHLCNVQDSTANEYKLYSSYRNGCISNVGRVCAKRLEPLLELWRVLNYRDLVKDKFTLFSLLEQQIKLCDEALQANPVPYKYLQ